MGRSNNSNTMRSLSVKQRVVMVGVVVMGLFLTPLMIRFMFHHPHSGSRGGGQSVRVKIIQKGSGPVVTSLNRYNSMVTLYIDEGREKKKKAGWSTRQADGAPADQPFEFQPGVELIEGWTEGVLQMNEGERAWLYVPASKGYGSRAMGSPTGSYYIPANSDLVFDIEILGKAQLTNNHRRNDPHHHHHHHHLRSLWERMME